MSESLRDQLLKSGLARTLKPEPDGLDEFRAIGRQLATAAAARENSPRAT